ncbi:DUF4440 domain-containing protein [Streptomyces sp. NPDC088725]|uniref:nuclear transport factor 2 family protein n=1 Tax=Streptomyces sp. NPDC088725 TaxID=3365873 RepID=UPI00380024C5
MTDSRAEIDAAIESELRFLDPTVHTSPELLSELLDPDFRSFGYQGRVWDRASLIDELRSRAATENRPVTVTGLKAVGLAPGLVHVTFDAEYHGRYSHRSSLWRLTGDDWLLYFHQGTAFSPEAPDD